MVFLLLLVVAFAQVVWWVVDQTNYSGEVRSEQLEHWQVDLLSAEELLREGTAESLLRARYPHLEFGGGDVSIDPAALEGLRAARREHVRQYVFEGLFFLFVLSLVMLVLGRILRQERNLRGAQQNFLAAVSHELKSPLASLRLSTETLLLRDRERSEATAQRHRLLERSLADVSRLERLVYNLLDTTRLGEPTVALRQRSQLLGKAVAEIVETLPTREEPDVAVSVEIASDLEVWADKNALDAVLRNLLANAVESVVAAGGGTVTVHAREEPHSVVLEVRDDGLGFAADEAERLFDRFYRTGDEMTRRTRGTGLGLWLARRFLQLEGARVRAESAGPGTGASFVVEWPRRERTP